MRMIALTLLLAAPGCATLSASPTQSATPEASLEVAVAEAPPPDQHEDKPAAPGYGYIWVSGYWDNLDGRYIWRPGRWVQGKANYEYVRARYEQSGKGWVFHRPYWHRRHSPTVGTATANAN